MRVLVIDVQFFVILGYKLCKIGCKKVLGYWGNKVWLKRNYYINDKLCIINNKLV